jgi:hypothetical protein
MTQGGKPDLLRKELITRPAIFLSYRASIHPPSAIRTTPPASLLTAA